MLYRLSVGNRDNEIMRIMHCMLLVKRLFETVLPNSLNTTAKALTNLAKHAEASMERKILCMRQ